MRLLAILLCLLPCAVLAQAPNPDNHPPIMTGEDRLACLHYPDRAHHQHVEGITKLSFTVGADGISRDIAIVTSSNSDDLDQQALECVKSRTFTPALSGGQPVEAKVSTIVTYAMDPHGRGSISWRLGAIPNGLLASAGISLPAMTCLRAAPVTPAQVASTLGPTNVRVSYDDGAIAHVSVAMSSGVTELDEIALDCFKTVPQDTDRAKTLEKTRSTTFVVSWIRLFPASAAAK